MALSCLFPYIVYVAYSDHRTCCNDEALETGRCSVIIHDYEFALFMNLFHGFLRNRNKRDSRKIHEVAYPSAQLWSNVLVSLCPV